MAIMLYFKNKLKSHIYDTVRTLNFIVNFSYFWLARKFVSINFCSHGGVAGTIGYNCCWICYCGLIFVDKRHITKSTKIYASQEFLCVQYSIDVCLHKLFLNPMCTWYLFSANTIMLVCCVSAPEGIKT